MPASQSGRGGSKNKKESNGKDAAAIEGVSFENFTVISQF